MRNSFFTSPLDISSLSERLNELEKAKVGFFSVGLYPASLAYNCAMQTDGEILLLAPRKGRDLLGAFSQDAIAEMDDRYLEKMEKMSTHLDGGERINNDLSYLLLKCEIVFLASNSRHIKRDLNEACKLREKLGRDSVVLSCFVGSFCFDEDCTKSYILCEKVDNLGFFSGFHRHDALRNPLDSFTANFCHPDPLTALIGAIILDRLSPNIKVSAGIHNIEGQYIKAAKNMSSIFAGFVYRYHSNNNGLLPGVLTLLHDQCLDQAATVSMNRSSGKQLKSNFSLPLTELGYGVERIEASLLSDNLKELRRDQTFSQLTAMVADIRGSMMPPLNGKATRNFQAGVILAEKMLELGRCPHGLKEFLLWCKNAGLNEGGLEGINALKSWPQIISCYSLSVNDSSMVNLLYLCLFADESDKKMIFTVMTDSRELTNYCNHSFNKGSSSLSLDISLNSDKFRQYINSFFIDLKSEPDINIGLQKIKDLRNDNNTNPKYIDASRLVEEMLFAP